MARLSKAEKEKRKPKFFAKLFSSPRKDKAKAASKKAEATSTAKKKMYAAESMFKADRAKKAATRDEAKLKLAINHLNLHSMLLQKQVRVLSLMVESLT